MPRFARTSRSLEREADLFLADAMGLGPEPRAPAWPGSRARGSERFFADLLGLGEEAEDAGAAAPAPAAPGVVLSLRDGHRVTGAAAGVLDNVREDVLQLLDRLHMAWSITNDAYDDQFRYVSALPPGAQVPQADRSPPAAAGVRGPWSFRPTLLAIERNRGAHLAAPVIEHFMGFPATKAVGDGQPNLRDDVLAVMTRLNFLRPYAAFAAEASAVKGVGRGQRVGERLFPDTLLAIRWFKEGLAQGTLGWRSIHADEREFGGDRFAGRTATVTVQVTANHTLDDDNPAKDTREYVALGVFLPARLSERNNVHIFFSPGNGTEENAWRPGGNATNVHGLRAAAEAAATRAQDPVDWIVIGVPGFEIRTPDRKHEHGWNSVDLAAVRACLERAGRPSTDIHRLRMSGHSRGVRSMRHTLALSAKQSIPSSRLPPPEQIVTFDNLDGGLAAPAAALAKLARVRPPTIRQYTKGPLSGHAGDGLQLDGDGVRALGLARLIEDQPDPPAPAEVRQAIAALLPLPPRGRLTTRKPPPAGSSSIHAWIKDHLAAIVALARIDAAAQTEWFRFLANPATTLVRSRVDRSPSFFVNTQNLMRFFPGPLIDPTTGRPSEAGFDNGIWAHHLFVAELAHELFE